MTYLNGLSMISLFVSILAMIVEFGTGSEMSIIDRDIGILGPSLVTHIDEPAIVCNSGDLKANEGDNSTVTEDATAKSRRQRIRPQSMNSMENDANIDLKAKERQASSQNHFGNLDLLEEKRFRRALNSIQEKVLFKKKHEFSGLDEHEIENTRRRFIKDHHLICPRDNHNTISRDDCFVKGLHLSMKRGKGLNFCRDCLDAHKTGSWIDTWEAHFGPSDFHVDGLLVYAVPNHAKRVLNKDQVRGNVVLVDRGGSVPVWEKIKGVQDAGGVAVIIADNGKCSSTEFYCGKLGNRRRGNGFAEHDLREHWDQIHIPSVLVLKNDGERIKQALKLIPIMIPNFGKQLMVNEEAIVDG